MPFEKTKISIVMEKSVFFGKSPYEAPETDLVIVHQENCFLQSTDINSADENDMGEIGA